jgi:hypothetical protein
LSFSEPIYPGTGLGYEPGIDVDSAGTVFVTAHKRSLAREEGNRLSSYLWRSTDGGTTFTDMSGMDGATRSAWAFEGDLAVDAKDRVYFVDTTLLDNHMSRYSDNGATLDFYRPAVPSVEVDDRPWLAAHHDGDVYYMSNAIVGAVGRLVVHRSSDAGETFDPVGFTIPTSGWGFLDADPNSDYVYAFVNDSFYIEGPNDATATKLTAWISADRGQTWTSSHVANYEFGFDETAGHNDAYPVIAVSPTDGSVYALWTDDGRRLKLAHSVDHGSTWTVHDITPFAGTYSFPWLSVSPTGDVGIVFEAAAKDSPAQYLYGMIWRAQAGCDVTTGTGTAACDGPAAVYSKLSPKFFTSANSQADFFQTEFTPDGTLFAAYTGPGGRIAIVHQTSGPGATRFCGTTRI